MMETEKCYKLKGLRMGDTSAVSPLPSPRTGDDARPSSTVRQREREHPFLLLPPRFFSSGLQKFGWGPPTLGGLPSPLSLWIQMPASSGDTFTETLRITFNQIPGRLATQSSWQIRWTIIANIQHNSQEFRSWTQTQVWIFLLFTRCVASSRLPWPLCAMVSSSVRWKWKENRLWGWQVIASESYKL